MSIISTENVIERQINLKIHQSLNTIYFNVTYYTIR